VASAAPAPSVRSAWPRPARDGARSRLTSPRGLCRTTWT
jgi:hypothetical protein